MPLIIHARVLMLAASLLALIASPSWAGTISVNPTSADAGTVGLNVVSPNRLCYIASNTGSTNLTLTSVTTSNPEFSVIQPSASGLPLVIAPGGSYAICVQFKPNTAGARSATIGVQTNDSAQPLTNLTATGYGGIEQSIVLSPAQAFEIDLGQGASVRAQVTFDNGATGVALLSWTSSNSAVATAGAGDLNNAYGAPVPTGSVQSVGLGDATITVAGVTNPAATSAVAIRVVAVSPFEFMATASSDRVIRVKNGAWSLCYDFPEVDINNLPVYNTNQIGVTTPSLNTIGNVYVTANPSSGPNQDSEQIFYLNNCTQRTTVFSQPLAYANFADLVVDSQGQAVLLNRNAPGIWQVTPTGSFPLPYTGLPSDDAGQLAIDSYDNLYLTNLVKTSTLQQEAAVYVRPFGTTTWYPIAAVFNALPPSSMGIPGMTSIYEGNKLYVMKTSGSPGKTIVERYIDINADGSFFKIVGSSIVPDPGEAVEVARIGAGVDVSVDSNRQPVAIVTEPQGNAVVRLTDKNNDGDFLDSYEYRVIFQSNSFARIKDVAFAAPCTDKPPTAIINTLPANATVDVGEPITLIGVATDDCGHPLTHEWTNEDTTPPVVISREVNTSITYYGLPAIHKVGLKVCHPDNQCIKGLRNIKVGPPKITGVWPPNAVTNSVVFIFGKNFRTASGSNPKICFNNGTLCTPLVQLAAPDLLLAFVPIGATFSCITVETEIGMATYCPSPPLAFAITGLWPGEAKVGSVVFVFGAGFSTTPGQTQVDVNGTPAPLTQVLDKSLLLFVVPPGATTGRVHVTVGGQTATSFTDLVVLP